MNNLVMVYKNDAGEPCYLTLVEPPRPDESRSAYIDRVCTQAENSQSIPAGFTRFEVVEGHTLG